MENPEKYVGYGNLLNLPSGRVCLELTLNNLEELKKAIEEGQNRYLKEKENLIKQIKNFINI